MNRIKNYIISVFNKKIEIIKLRTNHNNVLDSSLYKHLVREGKFRKKLGRTLVQVTSHGGSCSTCKKWEKKILIDDIFSNGKSYNNIPLLSDAIKKGLFHKGCRHGITTYYPELKNIENVSEKEHQQDIEYINEKILNILPKK